MWVQSLASLGGLRIQRCRELWCRRQARLGSCVAVTVPIRSLAWEPPYAVGSGPRKGKKKKEKEKRKGEKKGKEREL